ncbi:hypothetical protein ASZ90_019160 [hydrocarbon metagenome]|uniref:DUF4230 domain-containing protein n=1 Tax=hydrocarbon metagenome TaxID=938273 RepID=A0A0W8E400_9ZZZZ
MRRKMSYVNDGQMIGMKHTRTGLVVVYAGIFKKGIIILLLLGLMAGGITWLRYQNAAGADKTAVDNAIPFQITSELVIERLYSEGTLNVLEAVGRASYQVEDPGTIKILNRNITIPGRQKQVSVNYEYKVHLGIDLTRLTAQDISITETSIEIMLPRPEIKSIEIYNDKAQTTGGFLIFKTKPRDDLVEMSADKDGYVTILRDSALRNLQESGRYQKLQQIAMNNTVDLLARLLQDLSQNNELKVKVQFI